MATSTQFYKQKPVMPTSTRSYDGRTNVDIRIGDVRNADLSRGRRCASGLPEPQPYKSSSGRGNAQTATREITVAALADLPAVLAFYHREFAARGWAEQGSAPLAPGDEVALKFSSPEENGVLHLGRKYDFTMVHLTAQVKESVLAARARAKKDADDQFMKDAEAMTKQVLADDGGPAQDAGRRALRCAAAGAGRQHHAGAVAGECAGGGFRRRQRPARIQRHVQRQGACRVLPGIAEAGGLEGAAVGHQPAEHGRAGVLEGRQVDLDLP